MTSTFVGKRIYTNNQNPNDILRIMISDHRPYEVRSFISSTTFELYNFVDYISQVSTPDTMVQKIFNLIYFIFEYEIEGEYIVVLRTWELPIWKLPRYGGKHRLSFKGDTLISGPSHTFDDQSKTLHMFIANILASPLFMKISQAAQNEFIQTVEIVLGFVPSFTNVDCDRGCECC